MGKDAAGEDAQKAHTGMVRQVLRSGTKVSLDVRSHRPAKRDYRIERVVPNPPVIRDDSGQISNLLPQDILPGIEIYGQHEISEIARSPEKLTSLLDRFVTRDESLNRRKLSVRRDLEQTIKAIIDTQSELNRIEERLAALPGLEETLERYREAGGEEHLGEQSLLVYALPPATVIKLNTAPSGAPPVWQAPDELSTGHKATAVLLKPLSISLSVLREKTIG